MAQSLKDKIREDLVSQHYDLLSKLQLNPQELKDTINKMMDAIFSNPKNTFADVDRAKLIKELVDEFVGLGPIDVLMKDSGVTEVMINGPKRVYVERRGNKELSDITFESENQLMSLVQKMLMPTRRRVDESSPYTDFCLKDGSRVNVIIYPVVMDGPVVTIRKFLKEIKTVEDLLSLETLDKRMADFLVAAIKAKLNIIMSGSTGSGKTTTLNVLASYISSDERIVTIEDTTELNLPQDHVIRLQAKQANIDGKGEITIRNLFRNALRMRPKRIIIGEIRGAEAFDMLQAICSGHGGSLAVIHAENPQDVIYRIETMIITSGLPITLDVISRHVAASVNIILHQEQLLDGSRKITHITAVNGLKNGQVVLEDLFTYDIESSVPGQKVMGRWKATGVMPVFYPVFARTGVELSKEIFNKD
ncbi:MAG: CpaF family protein [Candidatus Omnitrophica bacterium]|nr:CpaF family protein [Candidatus Omnitrophota bacterium]